jgi:hypothetical protein
MGKQTSLKRNDVISASEIGQYMYCSIAWCLQRHGHEPISPMLEVGKKAHIDLGQTIDNIQDELGSSRRFALIGYLFLILAIIIIIYGVIL